MVLSAEGPAWETAHGLTRVAVESLVKVHHGPSYPSNHLSLHFSSPLIPHRIVNSFDLTYLSEGAVSVGEQRPCFFSVASPASSAMQYT